MLRLIFYIILSIRLCPIITSPILNDIMDIWYENQTNKIEEKNLRLARVLNFFPVPVEEECLSNDGRRKGVCMNAYECHIQSGKSYGPCALGFGVCCVFTTTCNGQIFNNLTYFINPDFPDLTEGISNCTAKVKKIDPEIVQLRLDFIHFNLGQPNRRTGVCEEDIFIIAPGTPNEFKLCGLNSGQHAYFDIEIMDDVIDIEIVLNRRPARRLWEIRIMQIPFADRAPNGCLQYHTGSTGTIRTMNFAENGRHLAEQDYNVCVRQESGMCTIAYEPCDADSFRIGPNTDPVAPTLDDLMESGSGGGATGDGRQMSNADACGDRIVLPCDAEELLPADVTGGNPTPFCDIIRCGSSLCDDGSDQCRIESSITPFMVGVHFGPSLREQPPDDNIGMCLNYEQLPCS